ncbi:MAG: TonB-dependent receptor [Bryobacterales bacterium]|nr:TonB-dependent receptor [Bryobacterales bacterium]
MNFSLLRNTRAALCLLLVLLPVAGLAQTGQGIMTGLVTDSSGAIIPGVNLRITNRATGFVHTAQTNAEGLYRVPYLTPGMYEVIFESEGFRRIVRSNIQVRSTETVRLDATLEVGSVVEQIEVAASASLLETETSMTGHLVTGTQLTKLPTPQMKIESMLWLVPGVTGQAGSGHAAGGRSRAFVIANDGVSGMTPGTGSIGTGRNMSTAQHAMEEIKVLTTTLPAEYGHSGGGMMNVNYKSGTNDFHGVLEERYMARHFIHRNWQDANLPTNNFGFHLMSAMFSGPIKIPKIYDGKNRTFFMWAFQRHHEKASENNDRDVPTPRMLAGDFAFDGLGFPVYDPATLTRLPNGDYTRTQFPGNQVPVSRFDPVYQNFLNLNPWAAPNNRNNQAFTNATGDRQALSADTVYRSYRTSFDHKIDHSFSDAHKIFGRYSLFRHRSFNGRWQIASANPDFDFNTVPIPINHHQVVISDSFTLSPTVVNEFRIGMNRRNFQRNPSTMNQDWGTRLGMPNVDSTTMPIFVCGTNFTAHCGGTPGGAANAAGVSGMRTLYTDFHGGRSQEVAESYSLQENLTIVRGRHTLKMGYEYLNTRHNVLVASAPGGVYRMGGTEFPFRPNTGHPLAAFQLGSVVQAEFTNSVATWLPRWNTHSFYVQTDWRARQNLTFNLGLRWQYESPFTTKWNQQSQFDPTAIDPLTGRQGALTHPTGFLANRDLNNFQPRVGMAYTINPRLVFRGGFAVNTLDLWTNGLNENFEEYFATAVVQREPGNPDISFYLRDGPPSVTFPVQSDGTVPFSGSNFASRTASFFDRNMRMPYIMNWNGSLQWEAGNNMLLELSYQGSGGVGLLNNWNINQIPLNISTDPVQLETIRRAAQNFRPFPHFGTIRHYSNYGHSSFHSGTIKFERRYSRGFNLTTFYTWSKSMDEASNDGGAGGIDFYNRRLEKARSNHDVRHRWVTYALYELPFGRGRRFMTDVNPIVNGVLGGWEFNAIQTFESGTPIGFGFTGTSNVFLPMGLRPNMAPGKTYEDIKVPWDRKGPCRHQIACAEPWADINAFAYPDSFTAGNSGRNIITSPGMMWHQFSLSKAFRFKERVTGSLRYDINNPFKYYFFNNPGTTVDFRNPQNFGKITGNQGSFSGLGGRLYQQIMFKVEW